MTLYFGPLFADVTEFCEYCLSVDAMIVDY